MADPWAYVEGSKPASQQFYTIDPATGRKVVNRAAVEAERKRTGGGGPTYKGPIDPNWKPGFEQKQNVDFYGKPVGTANPAFFADAPTANYLAQVAGGQVFQQPQAGSLNSNMERWIRLPNGQTVNAGMLADEWQRNVVQGSSVNGPSIAMQNILKAFGMSPEQAQAASQTLPVAAAPSPVQPAAAPVSQNAGPQQANVNLQGLLNIPLGGGAPQAMDPWSFQPRQQQQFRPGPFAQYRSPFSQSSLGSFLTQGFGSQGGF